MGINDLISSIFSSWRKRKRGSNDEQSNDNVKKQKVATDYLLSPAPIDKKTSDTEDSYILGEECLDTENRVIEYKEGGFLFKNEVLSEYIRKYASAFLNSEGGKLMAGINDRGIVKGVYVSPKVYNEIKDTFRYEMNQFRPYVPSTFFSIKTYPVISSKRKFLLSSNNDLCILEFNFKKGIVGEIYETGDHQIYLRRDGGVHGPLRPLDIKNLVISKYNDTLIQRKKKLEAEDQRLPPSREVITIVE